MKSSYCAITLVAAWGLAHAAPIAASRFLPLQWQHSAFRTDNSLADPHHASPSVIGASRWPGRSTVVHEDSLDTDSKKPTPGPMSAHESLWEQVVRSSNGPAPTQGPWMIHFVNNASKVLPVQPLTSKCVSSEAAPTAKVDAAYLQQHTLHGLESLASLAAVLVPNDTAIKASGLPAKVPLALSGLRSNDSECLPTVNTLLFASCPPSTGFDETFVVSSTANARPSNETDPHKTVVQTANTTSSNAGVGEQVPMWLEKAFRESRLFYYVSGIVCDCAAGLWFSGLAARYVWRNLRAMYGLLKSLSSQKTERMG